MSIAAAAPSHASAEEPSADRPRVRHQARDAARLMAFSAAASLGVAVLFLLLALAARQA